MPSRPLLCVDDESSNLATLRQLLRDDFPLVFAKSGGEALDAVSRHAPALILLDVELPDMDGYAVARTLKQQPSSTTIPILFVTSRSSEQDERAGLEAGAADYVSKPYSPALLKARIATQLKLAENVRLAQQYRDAIHLLGTAGQGQDADTGAHIWRMAVYARVLAETVGWSTQQAQLLQDAAPLHDAGKIAVPGSILHKPDALDEHEHRWCCSIRRSGTICCATAAARCFNWPQKSRCIITNAGTAAATPRGWPAMPFPNPHASWRWPTSSTHCAGGAPTRPHGRWKTPCASWKAWPANNWNRALCNISARPCRRSCRSRTPGTARLYSVDLKALTRKVDLETLI
ncbi:Sensor histidine kinase RcsC [Xanthomonas hortorum pv. pelargonii]|uniref:Sensor histidine kinase RcsC n=1 Tax=Xanthomonas hortorum pv. pelargonii TaxID=453602 RepID=A0A6V7CTR0_9XANT|nr:Sensor histidine kinase RcsC [Xanthomonas hortorum pv. pelargonii]CAD0322454.1 Sensor histidine kinase RcsC [Xanthomonas hortorum pv. pelargonii]